MSQLAELAGVGWEREIGGRSWRFAPLTLADWAVLERRLLESRPDPLEIAKQHLEGLDAAAQRELFEAALSQATRRRDTSLAELLEFADSPDGLALSVWLSLRHGHPTLTETEASALLERMAADELTALESSLGDLRGLPTDPPKN